MFRYRVDLGTATLRTLTDFVLSSLPSATLPKRFHSSFLQSSLRVVRLRFSGKAVVADEQKDLPLRDVPAIKGVRNGDMFQYSFNPAAVIPEEVKKPEVVEEEGETSSSRKYPDSDSEEEGEEPVRMRKRRRRPPPPDGDQMVHSGGMKFGGPSHVVDYAAWLREKEEMIILIKKQVDTGVERVLMDRNAGISFEKACRRLCGDTMSTGSRMGYLYGFVDTLPREDSPATKTPVTDDAGTAAKYIQSETPWIKRRVNLRVQFIYEPLQRVKKGLAVELRDKYKSRATKIAEAFKMQRLGWIYCKSAKEELVSSRDAIRMAKLQNMFGHEFVTVAIRPEKSNPHVAEVCAFQVSAQFCDLVKAGLVKKSSQQSRPDRIDLVCPVRVVNEMLSTIDLNSWVVCKRAIGETKSVFYMGFPPRNRLAENRDQNGGELRAILEKRRRLRTAQILADFHLLLYLTDGVLNVDVDLPTIALAVTNPRNVVMAEKYKATIMHRAGL